ncbi:Protein AAR2 -like protein [Escovopsis weberi]|uniref:Protein AAR2-like protein n=1 Tax=Escovopsis weberi TaxID=150374 RepID=A0A0M9VVL2_ESCWE|nr:Protein AAR2 -like protein [Escovopsis weberi]
MHPPATLGGQSPSAECLRDWEGQHDDDSNAYDDDDHDGNDGDDGDDSSPPPLISPSSCLDSPAAPGEPPSRPASRPPPASANELPTHRIGGGDVVLIANLPEVFTVGYDSVSFTARHFGGVREIPRGPHFFWVSHPSGASARNGFWTYCGAGAGGDDDDDNDDRVHMLEWDRFYEVLSEAPRAEARAQAARIEHFYAKLAPYGNPAAAGSRPGPATPAAGPHGRDLDANFSMWRQLTEHVSPAVLDRVAGRQGPAWHVHTADRVRGAVLLAVEAELDKRFASPVLEARELTFTFDQHARTYSAAALGADRSLAARDPTDFILGAMRRPDAPLTDADVVGELQLAYVSGMHLGNDACVQQWWHMVLRLFLRAHALVDRRPSLAAAVLHAVATQLVYGYDWLDGSILDYGDAGSRDLRLALIVYKRRLEEALAASQQAQQQAQAQARGGEAQAEAEAHGSAVLAVATAFARLEAGVAPLGWDLRGDYVRSGRVMLEDGEEVELDMAELEAEDERGEWAPEVVEMDENGRELGLISWSD